MPGLATFGFAAMQRKRLSIYAACYLADMQALKMLPVLLFVAVCGSVFSSESTSFDIPGGSYRILFSGPLVPGTLVKCQFAAEQTDFGGRWLPSVAIFFESEEQVEDGGTQIRLTARGSEKDQGWRHRFTMYRGTMDRKSEINVHTGTTESVMQLNLILTDDESVVFFVGTKAAEYSEIDISPTVLTKWRVVAAGVRGTGECDRRLPVEGQAAATVHAPSDNPLRRPDSKDQR